MSASSEYEPVAHKNYGPAASSPNVFDGVLDPKVADMNVPVRPPILRAVRDQPDSTNPENILHNKRILTDTEFHVVEKRSVETATDEIVREAEESKGHVDTHIRTLPPLASPPTMWLPGVLTAPDRREDLSHIIISEPYETQPRSTSKVQIISNIALTKAPSYSPYDRHLYKLSTPKIPSSSVISGPVKNTSYIHTLSKGSNRVNNGVDPSNMLTVSAPGHVVSRPTTSHKSSRKSSSSSGRGSRSGNNATPQKSQSRPVKIVQQSPAPRSWPSPRNNRAGVEPANVIQRVGSPQYGPPAPAPSLRYVPSYGDMAQIAANQQLTAQILQSLSQTKSVTTAPLGNRCITPPPVVNDAVESPFGHTRRIIFGDSTTPSTTDDIHGTEERPNLPQELLRYSLQTLAFVMLDHTYALKLPPAPPPLPAPIPPPVTSSPPVVVPPMTSSPPIVPPPAPPVTSSPPVVVLPPVTSHTQPEEESSSSSSECRSRGGSDTETAPEGEDEGRTRCICDFTHDDGYMICCDRCGEWQHVDCMGVDRDNIPDAYECAVCRPRPLVVDRRRARALQLRKRDDLFGSDCDAPGRLTVTTYHGTANHTPTPRRQQRRRRNTQNQSRCEPAFTNHYSPELRARLHKLRLTSGPLPAPGERAARAVPHAGGHVLVAALGLPPRAPVLELRGKYMLWAQRKVAARPTRFVFRYQLRPDTHVCIDARTYGNEARYVRRSCQPNAELQHYVAKGALHVFIVTTTQVQSDTEITVGHDTGGKQLCACANPNRCKADAVYTPREKRARNRRQTASPAKPKAVTPESPPSKVEAVIKNEIVKEETKKESVKEEIKPQIDETPKPEIDLPEEKPPKIETKAPVEDIKIEKMLEEIKKEFEKIEESKVKEEIPAPIEDIQPEKPEEKYDKEEQSAPEPVKEESLPTKEEMDINEEEKLEKLFSDEERSKGECVSENERVSRHSVGGSSAKSACHDRSARSSRNLSHNNDSMDDKTDDSQDKLLTAKEKDKKKMTREERKMEAIMKAFERMERQQQKKQEVKERQKRRESDPVHPPHTPHSAHDHKDDDDDITCNKKRKKRKGRARTTSQGGCRPRTDSADSEHDNTLAQDLGLSPACLLVEAAVGSVESTFKLPKTKKSMVNDWIGQSPSRTPSPYQSPYRPPLGPGLGTGSSLESLVLATTIIGDLTADREDTLTPTSPPRRDKTKPPKKSRKVSRSIPEEGGVSGMIRSGDARGMNIPLPPVPAGPAAHSAKKRWLRQAISEESDSPTAESPPNEMITPLKKRRMARESVSYEANNLLNEDSSPRPNFEDSPVKSEVRSPLTRSCKVRNFSESLYYGRSRSESGHGSDDQSLIDASNDVLNANIKGPHDSENIRRIIGIPTPDEMDQIHDLTKTDDDVKTTNNNIGENASGDAYNSKGEPMDIDTTITPVNQIIHTDDNATSVIIKAGSPIEKLESVSANTSGNSSPQRDEMDDIQKKIHSFHTENIMILQSRNKKPPKEKRKKVNLNFDLNMVDDQISIQLRTDRAECNGDVDGKLHYVSTENIPLPNDTFRWPNPENIPLPGQTVAESIPLPEDNVVVIRSGSNSPELVSKDVNSVEDIPLPSDSYRWPNPENIPLPEESSVPAEVVVIRSGTNSPEPIQTDKDDVVEIDMPSEEKESLEKIIAPETTETKVITDSPKVLPNVVDAKKCEPESYSRGLFSGIFNNMNQKNDTQDSENVQNMEIIKNAIDHSAFLDKTLFDKETKTADEELKNVREILSLVNSMQSSNSVILSGVLRGAEGGVPGGVGGITEGVSGGVGEANSPPRARLDPRLNPPPQEKPKPVRRKLSISEYRKRHKGSADEPVTSTSTPSTPTIPNTPNIPSIPNITSTPADLEARLQHSLANSPPTVLERTSNTRREKLSTRLRREFGLALPDDDTLEGQSTSSAAAR